MGGFCRFGVVGSGAMRKISAESKISRQFLAELKLHDLPAYKIAARAGVNGNTLSKLICGILPCRREDERIIAVGKVLCLEPAECFER